MTRDYGSFPPPPPVQPNYAQPEYRGTSGLAITSLVLGIVGLCVPPLGIGAIICGAIGLGKTKDPGVGGRGLAIAGLTLGCVGIVLSCVSLSILLPALNRARQTASRVRATSNLTQMQSSLSRARETSIRVQCASNLKQIGSALLLYSNKNHGQYPPDLETALNAQHLSPEVFVCPDSGDTPAPGVDSAAQAKNLSAGGHLSYIYLGKRMTSSEPPDTIVAYENPNAHQGDGMNVLYGDGHVDFISKPMVQKMLAELKAGHNPPDLSSQ